MKLSPDKIDKYRRLMRNNIKLFGEIVCKNITFKKSSCVLHDDIYENHLKRTNHSVIISPRGHSKCVDPYTNIFTPWGNKLAKDIQLFDIIYAIDANNKLCQQVVLNIEHKQKKNGYLIKTRTGTELLVSDKHRMFTFDGYKEVNDLTTYDYLGSLCCEIDGNLEIDEHELRFITYMIFEGHCGYKKVKCPHFIFTSADEAIQNDFRKQLKHVGYYETKQFSRIDLKITTLARPLLQKYGILQKSSKKKRLPSYFFSLSLRQKWQIIGIMIDTDGFVAKQAGLIGISLANEDLINDLKHLLATCGIIASKSHHKTACNGKQFDAWTLTINGKYADKILQNCHLLVKEDAVRQLTKKYRYSLYDIFPNRIKKCIKNIDHIARDQKNIRVDNHYEITRGKLERLSIAFPECITFQKNLQQDIFWDRIAEIIPTTIKDDFIDIETSGEHNFIANGLVSHNTSIASTICTAYDIAYDKEDAIILIKDTFHKAVTDLSAIVNIIKYNDRFTTFYDKRIFLMDRQDKVFILNPITKHKTYLEVKGMGQSIRGSRSPEGKRPSKLILDDIENELNTITVEQREKIKEYIAAQVLPAPVPEKGVIQVIGTIVHYDSWLNNIWEGYQKAQQDKKEYGWKVIFHQIEEDGKPIWPEMFPPDYIETLKQSYMELGRIDKYYQEYMNIPFNLENATFRKDQFNHYTGTVSWDEANKTNILLLNEVITGKGERRTVNEKRPVDIVIGYDISSGMSSDFTGINVLATDSDNNRYDIEADRFMLKPDQLCERLFADYDKYHPRLQIIEEEAHARIMTFWLSAEMRKRNKFLRLKPEKVKTRIHKGDKIQQGLERLYAQGIMHHLSTQTNSEMELLEFDPKKESRHDDILDAKYLANQYARPPALKADDLLEEKKKKKRSVKDIVRWDWMTQCKKE